MKCAARQARSSVTPRSKLFLLQKGRPGYLQNAGILLVVSRKKRFWRAEWIANGTTKSYHFNIMIPFALQHLLYNRQKKRLRAERNHFYSTYFHIYGIYHKLLFFQAFLTYVPLR